MSIHTDPPCRACIEESLEAVKRANERFRVLMEMAAEQNLIVQTAIAKHLANVGESKP